MQPTFIDGTVSLTPVEPESGYQVEQRTLVKEPGSQLKEPVLSHIQTLYRSIWLCVQAQKLNKLICLTISVLMLVQLALSLAVSNILQQAYLKGMNRHKIAATVIYWYLFSLFSQTFGLISLWNQWFWCAMVYVVMLLVNSSYVLSLLSCTVQSNCPTTALFMAIPRLGALVWVYWLVLAWLYVLIGLVGFYVTSSAFSKFGCEDDPSSSDIVNWPEGLPNSEITGYEEIHLDPIAALPSNNLVIISSPSTHCVSTGHNNQTFL